MKKTLSSVYFLVFKLLVSCVSTNEETLLKSTSNNCKMFHMQAHFHDAFQDVFNREWEKSPQKAKLIKYERCKWKLHVYQSCFPFLLMSCFNTIRHYHLSASVKRNQRPDYRVNFQVIILQWMCACACVYRETDCQGKWPSHATTFVQ